MTKKKVKKEKSTEPAITDIAREYFTENGIDKVKLTYLDGQKVVKEEILETINE